MKLESLVLFSIKLCVKEVEEEVNIDLGLAKHVEDGLALVLEPQKLLNVEGELLHLYPHKPNRYLEHALLFQGQENHLHVLEMIVRETLDLLKDPLLVKLGGGVLEGGLGPKLLALVRLVVERSEVNPLVVPRLVKVGEAMVDVGLVLLQLCFHVVLLGHQTTSHSAGLGELSSSLESIKKVKVES